MKIKYFLILTVMAGIAGYVLGAYHTESERDVQEITECVRSHGCIDFNAHPELIGGGLVLEPLERNLLIDD